MEEQKPKKLRKPKFIANLQRYAEDHPEYAIGLAIGAVGAASQLMKAYSETSYARIHKREIKRREAIARAEGKMK